MSGRVFWFILRISIVLSTESIINNVKLYVVEITTICFNDVQELDIQAVRFHLGLLDAIGRRNRGWGTYLGVKTYDICNDTMLLSETLSDILLNSMFKNNGIKDTQCSRNTCINDTTNILAIISFIPHHLHHLTKLIAEVLTLLNLPYFPYTGNDTIQQIDISQNYHNSYKLLFYDISIVEKQIIDYKIRHVSLVIFGKDNFASFHRQKLFEMLVKHNGLCVDVKDIENGDYTLIQEYMARIRNDSSLKMIFIWDMRETEDISQMDLVKFTYGVYNKVWYWYPAFYIEDFKRDILSLETNFIIYNPLHIKTLGDLKYADIKQRVGDSIYNEILSDKLVNRYMKEKGFNRNQSKMFESFDKYDSMVDIEIESLLHLLRIQLPCRDGEKMDLKKCNQIYIIYYVVTKYGARAKESHDFNVTDKLLRLILSENTKMCEKKECDPGFQSLKSIFHLAKDERRFGWRCTKCPANLIKSSCSNLSCYKCNGEWIPNSNHTSCYDPYQNIHLSFFNKHSTIIIVFTIPSLTFNVIAIITYIRYRDTPVIRSAGPYRSLIQLISHLFIFVTVLTLFIAKLTFKYCILQVVITGYLLTIIMSLKITKIQTLLFAFQSKIPLDQTNVIIAKGVELAVFITLNIINGIISFLSFKDNSKLLEVSVNRIEFTRTVNCLTKDHFNFQLIFIFFLSLFCAIQAFRSRNLPRCFVDTTKLTYSIYVTIIIIIVRFPLVYQQPNNNHNFINAVIITLINSSQLFIDFYWIIFIVVFHPERNTIAYFRELLMKHSYKRADIELREHAQLMERKQSAMDEQKANHLPAEESSRKITNIKTEPGSQFKGRNFLQAGERT